MFCPKCGKDIGEARFCPDCGTEIKQEEIYKSSNPKEQKPPKKRRGCLTSIIIFLVFICVLSAVIANSEPTTNVADSGETEQTQTIPDLELIDYSDESDGLLRYVVGHIKNNTNRTYSYVQISINLYNDGTQVGSTLANVNNLEAGSTWEFKALITEDSATEYKIADISGW